MLAYNFIPPLTISLQPHLGPMALKPTKGPTVTPNPIPHQEITSAEIIPLATVDTVMITASIATVTITVIRIIPGVNVEAELSQHFVLIHEVSVS